MKFEKVLFFKNMVDFLQKNSQKFSVLHSRLTNSREIFPSNFALVRTKLLLSVFQSLGINFDIYSGERK